MSLEAQRQNGKKENGLHLGGLRGED